VRIDSGGPQEPLGGPIYDEIKAGYRDVIDTAKAVGVEVLVENHWGPTVTPENCLKLLDDIDGLGLLLDCHNFLPERRDDGRRLCASRAKAIHLKTFLFDAAGNEISDEKAEEALHILKSADYSGVWGVESVPNDGDEIKAAKDTIALIRRVVGG
jgi:sugar phosphate isomerase/epimerase